MSIINHRSKRVPSMMLILAQLALGLTRASAQIPVYSDLATDTGYYHTNGQAGTYLTDGLTVEVADELTLAPGYAGSQINGYTFTVVNGSSNDIRTFAWRSV
jgi:hypothetical protein